jgi:proline iminopeptidase
MLRIILAIIAALAVAAGGFTGYAFFRYQRVSTIPRACLEPGSSVSVNGYDLFVRVEGTRTDTAPVIVIHGGPGDSILSFKHGLDFLAADRRVLFYDQRGSGKSEVKAAGADLTVEAMVLDIEALRRDVLKADKVIIFGHSFGGALAQRYSLAYPDRVEKLILAGSIKINNGMKSPFFWRYFGPALYATAMGLPPRNGAEADAWMTAYADKEIPGRMADPANAAKLRDTGTVSFVTWRDITASLAGKDYRNELSKFQPETLFIYGAHDDVYTGEPVAKELAGMMPNFRMVRFEHSGHWMYVEEPEHFVDVVNGFLGASLVH